MSMENYRTFGGIVPEAASVANVLAGMGITAPHTGEPWSEALLFGLGGGIAAGYFLFEYEGHDPTVYIGTRYLWHDPAAFIGNIVRALGGTAIDNRTGSPAVASNHLQEELAKGAPVIVIADAAMFRHNGLPSSWEGALAYPLVVIGLEGNKYLLDDRSSRAMQVSAKDLADARNRIKKMKNAAITILPPTEPVDVRDIVSQALKQAAMRRLSPGIEVKAFANNFGLSGLHRWSDAVHDAGGARGWRRIFSQDASLFSAMCALYGHVALWSSDGTGCRSLYAAWLREAADILADERIRAAATAYEDAAAGWQAFADALLPEAIDLFARARAALLRRETVRRERGNEGINEIVQQAGLLAEMGREAATGFRLDADTREGYFVTLEKCAAEVVKQEEKALQVLTEAVGG